MSIIDGNKIIKRKLQNRDLQYIKDFKKSLQGRNLIDELYGTYFRDLYTDEELLNC